MKNLILVFLIFTLTASAQDTEMLGFINQYRIANGKKALVMSKDLNTIAKNQIQVIKNKDSNSHSGLANEVVTMGHTLPNTLDEKNSFICFLDSVFNMEYVEPKTYDEVSTLTKLYMLFMFNNSPKHKAILLGDYKLVGFETIIKDIKYKPNTITIGDKVIKFLNLISHYEVKFYCVIDIK